tara:strand:+ start:360 stop:1544 length:1185 start_codon:yes stop_codon:yes gene_type:complete
VITGGCSITDEMILHEKDEIFRELLTGVMYLHEDFHLKKEQMEAANQKMILINEQLLVEKQNAEQAVIAKEEFLATMSHEIRTPLNSINGITHLLIDNEPKLDQFENLKNLNFATNNLVALINNVLDYTKINSGKIVFEKTGFDLKEYCLGTIHVFRSISDEKNIELKLEWDDNLDKKVVGDSTRLSQIINNLLSNAMKFTVVGSVTLKVEGVEKGKLHQMIKFSVIDTGIGISKDKQELIFEQFSQANTHITRKYGGTGLGLTISKRLLTLQESTLSVDSMPDEGSTFFFELKFDVDEVNHIIPTKVLNDIKNNHSLLNSKILLVEGNEMNIMIASEFLKKWGADIDVAMNGFEAVEKVNKKPFDLIFMDLQMPEMDGFEATKQIRQMSDLTK